MEGKRSGWLDALVARQSDFSSFDVDTPLLNWANALSITSTQHFLLRLVVVLPAFRQSVEDLAVLELTDNAGATALTAAATAIITASLLQLPYIQVVGVPEQPFVGEISRAFAVVQEAKSAQGHLSDVKDSLTYFFGQLLSEDAKIKANSAFLISAKEALSLPNGFSLSALGWGRREQGKPLELRQVIYKASQRGLNLSESRTMIDALLDPHPAECLEKLFLDPARLVQVAFNNFHQLAEHLSASLATRSADSLTAIFTALGNSLPARSTRSYNLLMLLYQSSSTVNLIRDGSSRSTGDELAARYNAPAKLGLWKLTLPTYLSRCFSSITEAETHRQSESDLDPDSHPAESSRRRRSIGRTSIETAEELGLLRAFIEAVDLWAVSQESIPSKVFARRDASSESVAPAECRLIHEAAQAVVVELRSFALEFARYKEAAILLRQAGAL